MLISHRPSASLSGWTSILFSMLFLYHVGELNVEAALVANEVLTVDERIPGGNLTTESPLDLWKTQEWENRLLGETLLKPHHKDLFQNQHNSLLHLKSPGKLPGIEFGVEMHSLQAIQSVVPAESLPKGFDLKQGQPPLLSPSIHAPDYNGGFLRFTW